MELIDTYLSALNERDSWNVDIAFNYVRDTNVNNVGSGKQVMLANGGVLTRSDDMMPQSAHGLAYSLDISRDFNLWGSNYLSVGNEFLVKAIGIIMNMTIFLIVHLLVMPIKLQNKLSV